jgi:NMD protein affecting ribosome stability and mRNA decay
MLRTIVLPPAKEGGRKTFECPKCHGHGLKKLTQSEVFLSGEYPAPQVEVRRCKSCGTLSERDKWIEDRLFWRGVA